MFVFFLILSLFLVLDLLWWWLSDRWLRDKKSWRTFNTIFLLAQIVGFGTLIGSRIAGVRWNLPTPWLSSVYLWHLLILPLLLVLGVCALPLLLFLGIRRFMRRRPASAPEPGNTRQSPSEVLPPGEINAVTQTRRQFLVTAATVAPPLLNLAFGGFSQAQIEQFRVRKLTLYLPGLPPALDGLAVAHLTDLHVGPFTSEKVVRRVAERVNSLHPDLILFTGDLINSQLSELPLGIDFIRSLEARFGVAAVEGNHDLFEGRAAFENAFRSAGLRLLVNQSEILSVRNVPIQLLGLRWGGTGPNVRRSDDTVIASSMRDLLALRDPAAFPILLAHHPHAFEPATAAGLPLTLAGHTHGGQLMLNPQVGPGPLMFRYWSGLYQRGGSQLIVGNGVGNWFPLRTAAPAEIIHLTLRRRA